MPNPIPLQLPDAAYLKDHRFNGRPVLPAVEAMELLAAVVAEQAPHIDVRDIREARFDKFVPLDTEDGLELWYELKAQSEGAATETVVAQLKSKRRGKRGIARTLTHAQMTFGGGGRSLPLGKKLPSGRSLPPGKMPPSIDRAADDCTPGPFGSLSPEQIYAELVPFGPSYRNIRAITGFDGQGIHAEIDAPALPPDGGPLHLGSPFVLDAAFHAACVWGQRHAGVVAFPMGLERRQILCPCTAGCGYTAVVRVQKKDPSLLVFDITIESQGKIHETVRSLRMRDVSGGRLKPPSWMVAGADNGAGA